jgi:hypothetical protein
LFDGKELTRDGRKIRKMMRKRRNSDDVFQDSDEVSLLPSKLMIRTQSLKKRPQIRKRRRKKWIRAKRGRCHQEIDLDPPYLAKIGQKEEQHLPVIPIDTFPPHPRMVNHSLPLHPALPSWLNELLLGAHHLLLGAGTPVLELSVRKGRDPEQPLLPNPHLVELNLPLKQEVELHLHLDLLDLDLNSDLALQTLPHHPLILNVNLHPYLTPKIPHERRRRGQIHLHPPRKTRSHSRV